MGNRDFLKIMINNNNQDNILREMNSSAPLQKQAKGNIFSPNPFTNPVIRDFQQGGGFVGSELSGQTKKEIIDNIRKYVIEYFGEKLITQKDKPEFHQVVKNFIKTALEKEPALQSNLSLQIQMQNLLFDDIIGFGPIQPLLNDDDITEIMVTRWNKIYVEKGGKMVLVPEITFNDETHLQNTIQKIVQPMGRKIDDLEPIVDTSLPDGSRVNATIPPASPDGATLTIRKFSKKKLTPEDYLSFGSLNEKMIEFLRFAVEGKANIIVAGGTGTGKTSLLNMISQFIPDHEAINTVEDTLELQLHKDNVRRFLARPAVNGKGALTIRMLVKACLRQRPDRIVVGEIRDGAIYDLLDALSSGHEGGMGTIHSKSPRHLVDIRIPVLMGMSDISMEPEAQKKMIADAIDLIVYIKRFKDGSRKITNITEVVGYGAEGASKLKLKQVDENKIYLKDIFRFVDEGYKNGKLQGRYVACNYIPKRIVEKAAIYNSHIDEKIFFEEEQNNKE